MDIGIDRTKLKKQDVDTSELIERISTGQAMLFTGAGFSSLTKNVNDEEPSVAKDLANEICKLGGFPINDDLRFATDYYIENCNVSDLIQLLKKNYTLTQTNRIHDEICSAKWRRFYTTNYDKSIEIASSNVGNLVECIDVSFPTDTYYSSFGVQTHPKNFGKSLFSGIKKALEWVKCRSQKPYIEPTKSRHEYCHEFQPIAIFCSESPEFQIKLYRQPLC